MPAGAHLFGEKNGRATGIMFFIVHSVARWHKKAPHERSCFDIGQPAEPVAIQPPGSSPDAEIFMAEVADEADYVGHHQQKIVLVFSAMRHFAEKLKAQGRKVHYLAYGQQAGITGMDDVLSHIADTKAPHKIFVAEPGEYRLDKVLRGWTAPAGTSLAVSYTHLTLPTT